MIAMNKGQLINELFKEFKEAFCKEKEKEVIQKYSQILNLKETEIEEIIRKKVRREKNKKLTNNVFNPQVFLQLKKDFISALSQEFNIEYPWDIFARRYDVKIDEWRKKAILSMLFYLTKIGRGRFHEEYLISNANGQMQALQYKVIKVNTRERLALLQVLFWEKQWNDVLLMRRNYYLIGLTEKNRIFTHPLSGKQAWNIARYGKWQPKINKMLFGAKRVIRQGEIGFIPLRRKSEREYIQKLINEKGEEEERWYGSHLVKGKFYFHHVKNPQKKRKDLHYDPFSDKYHITYVLDPVAIHERNQHDPLHLKGVFKLVKAYDGGEWNFSGRVRD